MKLLLGENLSRRLLESICDLFAGSTHVSEVGLASRTPDIVIWEYAKEHSFSILTADTDFITLSNKFGPPPKVILLENCDYPTSVAARLIRGSADHILRFESDGQALLILRQR
jgi:predicted nuclease of predicted toxin-antitoxin system